MTMGKEGVNSLLGSDVKLAEFILGADLRVNQRGDIEITSDEMNLAQAILHRLRTAKGELADLGHAEYGSTLLNFVGQPNSWVTRERLKLAIRDTIRQERRVKDIVSISVNPRLGSSSKSEGNTRKDEGKGTTISIGIERGEEEMDDLNDAESADQSPIASSSDLSAVDVDIIVVPVGSKQPLQLAFPFNLEAT